MILLIIGGIIVAVGGAYVLTAWELRERRRETEEIVIRILRDRK
jgi:hypothetical protein